MSTFQFNEVKEMKPVGYCKRCRCEVYEDDGSVEFDGMLFCDALCLGRYMIKSSLVERI